MVNNPKYRQNWIVDMLKANPTATYTDVFAKYWVQFAKSKVTFDKDWNKSNLVFKTFQETINKEILKETIRLEKKAVKRNILSKLDALEELTKIAVGKSKKVEGELFVPTFNEQTNAIKTIASFKGWEAPKKTDNLHKVIDFDITKIYDPKAFE